MPFVPSPPVPPHFLIEGGGIPSPSRKMSKKEKYARDLIKEFKPMELNEALTRLVALSETTNEIKNGISDKVWSIFDRYLRVTKDNFSDPDSDFTVDAGGVYFEGDDGACGSYETKYLTIDLRFFTHTEDAFATLEKRVALERVEAEERMKNARIKLKKDSVARLEQEIRELEG